jgi:hypothetical protein
MQTRDSCSDGPGFILKRVSPLRPCKACSAPASARNADGRDAGEQVAGMDCQGARQDSMQSIGWACLVSPVDTHTQARTVHRISNLLRFQSCLVPLLHSPSSTLQSLAS